MNTTQTIDIQTEIMMCEIWILENTKRLKQPKKGITTYGYKHKVENETGCYIHEDSFIQACINLGYHVTKNNTVNISII